VSGSKHLGFLACPPLCVRHGLLTGFYQQRVVQSQEDVSGLHCSRWWLSAGRLLLFAIYLAASHHDADDDDDTGLADVDDILASLKPKA